VTFASNKDDTDICFDLVDIVSWNIYAGWYYREPSEATAYFENLWTWAQKPANGGKGKPVIISEFGASAIYGSRGPAKAHWSEDMQADVMDSLLEQYLNHPHIMGTAIWMFCDCRVDPSWFNRRPRDINNKGIVDELRRRKLSYDVVKRRMHEAAKCWDT
jgi:beta-glucuronidase